MYIPSELRKGEMNTFGTYQSWHFEDWMEVFEDYEDGLMCDEWIKKNKHWLDIITDDYSVQTENFDAINAKDRRHGE